MQYRYPEYFYDFQCEASECSDTCCKGWEITIDPVSLKKYRKCPGFFGNRLKNSIDWERKSFEQYNGRCVFLNEDNLCDIYKEAGPQMLCKTCTRYPRHYEEYENLREISLSLSCPAAAKLILGSDKKVAFLDECRETPEEEYEKFDFFLFDRLENIRRFLYRVTQDRERSIEFRMALLLAVSHDLQNRILKKQLHGVDELLKRYAGAAFLKTAGKKFAAFQEKAGDRRTQIRAMWKTLYRLEALDHTWPRLLKSREKKLYEELTPEEYKEARKEFAEYHKEKDYEYEQLLMYYLFTYLCQAVYDEDLFGKVKLAVVHTMLIRELNLAVWLEKGKVFTFEDQIETAHRYARETEHMDVNLETMECMMAEEDLFCLEKLLTGVLGE